MSFLKYSPIGQIGQPIDLITGESMQVSLSKFTTCKSPAHQEFSAVGASKCLPSQKELSVGKYIPFERVTLR